MIFGLLLPNLPHVEEARVYYDAMLSLQAHAPHRFATFWHRLKVLFA